MAKTFMGWIFSYYEQSMKESEPKDCIHHVNRR